MKYGHLAARWGGFNNPASLRTRASNPPIALGKGVPIFSDMPAARPLELVSSKVFPLGSMAQIYRPA